MGFTTNQKFFKMRTCVIIKVSTNLFSIKDSTDTPCSYNSKQKIFRSSSGPNSASNRKSAGFQVVPNLITVIENVSKFELAIVVKK